MTKRRIVNGIGMQRRGKQGHKATANDGLGRFSINELAEKYLTERAVSEALQAQRDTLFSKLIRISQSRKRLVKLIRGRKYFGWQFVNIEVAKEQVQEDFADAVRNDPTMTAEQKARWLK
jgi:hypothetical protein